MISRGLRIREKSNDKIIIAKDILDQVVDGDKYFWSILYLEGEGSPKNISYVDLIDQIKISKNGYILSWEELTNFVSAIYSIYWINLIGCKKQEDTRKYDNDREMYESTDICIELFDSTYWEIFTKDYALYTNLINRFQIEKYLNTDFQEKQ